MPSPEKYSYVFRQDYNREPLAIKVDNDEIRRIRAEIYKKVEEEFAKKNKQNGDDSEASEKSIELKKESEED